jgi:splicing factor 3B subunit 5
MTSGSGVNGMTTDQMSARYLGTGHADLSKYEWLTNQHRDTSASIIGHAADQLAYYAVATNESIGRTRYQFLESMVQPCGPPPPSRNIDRQLEQKKKE